MREINKALRWPEKVGMARIIGGFLVFDSLVICK
jgi:hypothetical protein